MVIVPLTTMSPVVKCITGCGPLSQMSQLSQPEITLIVTAPLAYRSACPRCRKCPNRFFVFNLSS